MKVLIKWIDGEIETKVFSSENELKNFLNRYNPLKNKMAVIKYKLNDKWSLNK